MKITLGTYTKRSSQGIYTIELNEQEKRLENLALLHPIQNSTYLEYDRNRLYAVLKDGQCGLRMYQDGVIVNQVTQENTPPCFVNAIPEKQLVMSANYHAGHIDLYSTKQNRLEHLQRITYDEGSHAHMIKYEPRFDEVYVCDLGLDKVLTYAIQADRLVLKHSFNTQPKQGPRHFIVHPTLPIIYVLTELSSEVLVFIRHDDHLERIQTLGALPLNEDQIKWGAAIRISADGKFLYVSNRGHDSITVFSIRDDGTLETTQNISTYGKHPRDFNLSPDGRFVVVAHLDSDSLTLFERDDASGHLSLLQKDVFAPESVCVVF